MSVTARGSTSGLRSTSIRRARLARSTTPRRRGWPRLGGQAGAHCARPASSCSASQATSSGQRHRHVAFVPLTSADVTDAACRPQRPRVRCRHVPVSRSTASCSTSLGGLAVGSVTTAACLLPGHDDADCSRDPGRLHGRRRCAKLRSPSTSRSVGEYRYTDLGTPHWPGAASPFPAAARQRRGRMVHAGIVGFNWRP